MRCCIGCFFPKNMPPSQRLTFIWYVGGGCDLICFIFFHVDSVLNRLKESTRRLIYKLCHPLIGSAWESMPSNIFINRPLTYRFPGTAHRTRKRIIDFNDAAKYQKRIDTSLEYYDQSPHMDAMVKQLLFGTFNMFVFFFWQGTSVVCETYSFRRTINNFWVLQRITYKFSVPANDSCFWSQRALPIGRTLLKPTFRAESQTRFPKEDFLSPSRQKSLGFSWSTCEACA